MKRISFAFVAALGLLVNACEKHPAAETHSALHSEHEESHEAAAAAGHGGEAHANPTPLTPSTMPTNPAGSGPAATHDPALDKGADGKEPGAVKYFPNEGKK